MTRAAAKNVLRRWAGPAVSAAVLVVAIWRLGTGPFLAGLEAVDARALLAASTIFFVATLCGAWRWVVVSRGLGAPLSLPAAVAAYYRAVFLNLMLPAGIAGDVHRGVSHGRQVNDVGRGLRAVGWERGAGQVVQIVLTISVLLVFPSPVRSAMPFVAVAAVAVALGLVLVLRMRGGGSRWTRVGVTLGHAATFVVAARTAGTDAPLSHLLPLSMLALLAMVLPSIAGWGPREGATAWVFAAAGLGADRGAATAVAFGVLVLAASLPGAIVLVVGWLPRRRGSKTRSRGRVVFGPEGAADA